MDYRIIESINELKSDKLHGASWLTRQAINILILTIEKSEANNISDFIKELGAVSYQITQSRKNMISISNYISLFLRQISSYIQRYQNLNQLKNEVFLKSEEFLKQVEKTAYKVAEKSTALISNGDTIVTCSYSSLVCQTLELASNRNISFDVFICRSEVGGISYGEITRENLERYEIKSTIINDNDINKYLKQCSKTLTGADTILCNGDIVNGTPSLFLASTASVFKISNYTICENAKFDIHNSIGSNLSVENGFDRIPCGLWSEIVTESGVVKKENFENHLKYLKTIF